MKKELVRFGAWVWVALLLALATGSAHAQFEWSGAGGNDLWSNDANWTNATAPDTNLTGSIEFTATDLGNRNVMDEERRISGTAGNTTRGLHYNIGAADAALLHTTDLGGNRLILDGGSLQVGRSTTNSNVVISNGTLQLGGANAANLIVGGFALGVNLATAWNTGNTLRVLGTVDAENLNLLGVAYNEDGNGPGAQGELDLSGATIRSGADQDILRLTDLRVAYGGGATAPRFWEGRLTLPSSLRMLDTGTFRVGARRAAIGTLDFGSNSQLTNLTVGTYFGLADDSGKGFLENLPTNVDIVVGSAAAPAIMRMGWYAYDAPPGRNGTGTLVVVGGSFDAHLEELAVGYHGFGNVSDQAGYLDLRGTSVRFGGIAHELLANKLYVGSRQPPDKEGGGKATGTLRLPTTVTEIRVGELYLGYGYNSAGRIDIGSNSMLQAISVTNLLYWGGGRWAQIGYDDAGSFVDYLPTGVVFTVGSPASPAQAYIGRRASHYSRSGNSVGELRLTNDATFTGHFSDIIVGILTDDPSGAQKSTGIFDLRGSTATVFNVAGDFDIGAHNGAPVFAGRPTENVNGAGQVFLPACTVNITSNLWIGDTSPTSSGFLELNGTTVSVGQRLEMYPTGVITNYVSGWSGGIDMQSTTSSDLVVSNGANIHIVFEADPELGDAYWGMRMDGDQIALFEGLTNDLRLTWDTSGLSPTFAAMVGLQFEAGKTFLGFVPPPAGTVIWVK